MPVAKKTSKKPTGKSGRQPTTVTINPSRRPTKAVRSRGATIVTAGGRLGTPVLPEEDSLKPAKRSRKSGKDHGSLPSWKQLESKVNRKVKALEGSPFFGAISTLRFALILTLVAAAFTVYVGHVHATQEVLALTQNARNENHRLHLKYNRVKGAFDRLTGPTEIHRRARALGFIEDAAYGQTVILED